MTEGEPGAVPQQKLADAGEWLRMAREQSGLSIDAVAQQLKLAPRQVKAIEDGAYEALPGRTFVRGFVRNYARLLRLDPEAVVAALPDADAAPALEGPSIGSTSRPMGELPVTHPSHGPSWSRWAIPLALIAAVALAAVYEFTRSGARAPEPVAALKPLPIEPAPTDTPPAAGTPLPSPIAGPATGGAPAAAGALGDAPSSAAAESSPPAPATVVPVPPTAPAPGDATLVIHYKQTAWTHVKDANGQTILITNGQPGGTQTVHGKPPFDLVLGNAERATLTWRGQPFDLAPHTKGNVARVRLP
ncbi:MAG TPA: helix-turn-helix domain-containing protein [Casimicrobiaceae bacterium]|nr:helix-turn-helix domain-containing protein [Casimicrobiaceae bacterium]